MVSLICLTSVLCSFSFLCVTTQNANINERSENNNRQDANAALDRATSSPDFQTFHRLQRENELIIEPGVIIQPIATRQESDIERMVKAANNGTNRRRRGKTFVSQIAAAVKRYISRMNCRLERRHFTTVGRCEIIKSTRFREMRFYMAEPKSRSLYSVVIPEGRLKNDIYHSVVVVVDPFPRVSFGHLVMVFYIDIVRTRPWCRKKKGMEIAPRVCLTQAKRTGCRNLNKGRWNADDLPKKCEINFIPLVYDQMDTEKTQQLICQKGVAGFSSCPKDVVTSHENCEITNNHACHITRSARRIGDEPCRTYATCDHAVMLYGGWNNVTKQPREEENIQNFYDMLKQNGFRNNEIQIFYGERADIQLSDSYDRALPATDKLAIRNHISTLCNSELCVDSLVIYLNGPTKTDGSILLWDNNKNGETEAKEMYTVNEFLEDITNCNANHTFIFSDQSYAGMLTYALRHRINEANPYDREMYWNRIVLVSSGGKFDYSWSKAITNHWSNLSPTNRVSWAFETLSNNPSSPSLLSRRHAEDHTIYGAPIVEGRTGFMGNRAEEVRNKYMGCQDLPYPQWMLTFPFNLQQILEEK